MLRHLATSVRVEGNGEGLEWLFKGFFIEILVIGVVCAAKLAFSVIVNVRTDTAARCEESAKHKNEGQNEKQLAFHKISSFKRYNLVL